MYDDLIELISGAADNILSILEVVICLAVAFGLLVVVGLPKSTRSRNRKRKRRD